MHRETSWDYEKKQLPTRTTWEKMVDVRHSLYKYFSDRKWADAFLDGEVLFRSLSYFRDYEDENVRGDTYEGTAVYRPKEGLLTHNQTQGKSILLKDYSFESTANQDEIYVFCTSRSLSGELRERFAAVVCIEIHKISSFCARIERAVVEVALPATATFRAGRVVYYNQSEGGDPRWALPDRIALSKFESYRWQDEFRLLFCLTDALEFEKASYRLVKGDPEPAPKLSEYPKCLVKVRTLRDVCRLHEF